MKCPNCSKEAIFVNGKYVCLDCGIEISAEQQAAQNMSDQDVFASAFPANPIADEPASAVLPITPLITHQSSAPEPVVEEAPAPSTPTPETPLVAEKPVQQYYEEILKQDEMPSSPSSGSGIYDFSSPSPSSPAPTSVEPGGAEPTIASLTAPASEAQPTVEAEPSVPPVSQPEPKSEPELVSPTPIAADDNYFAPSSFNLQDNQNTAPVEPPYVAPAEPVVSDPQPYVAPTEPVIPEEPTPVVPTPAPTPIEEPVPASTEIPETFPEAIPTEMPEVPQMTPEPVPVETPEIPELTPEPDMTETPDITESIQVPAADEITPEVSENIPGPITPLDSDIPGTIPEPVFTAQTPEIPASAPEPILTAMPEIPDIIAEPAPLESPEIPETTPEPVVEEVSVVSENIPESIIPLSTDFPETTPETTFTSEAAEIPESAPEAIPTVTPEDVFNSTDDAPVMPPKTLDEMLGSVEASNPDFDSPVSAYGSTENNVVSNPVSSNITEEGKMPSVESVFGNTSADQKPVDSKLPTAQDFGVAPKPTPRKNKKWILPVVIGLVSILLLAGGALALITITNNNSQVKDPVTLNQDEIYSLSAKVSNAMQGEQGMAAEFNLNADLAALTVADATLDKATLQAQLAIPYQLSGSWHTDADGDINTDTVVGEVTDKRIYINNSSQTFVYSAATQTYAPEAGLVLGSIPAICEVEEKSALLYATNIESASLMGTEQIDGVEYSKYEIVPTEDIVKKTLGIMGGVFAGAQYQNINTGDLKVMVWLGNDDKLKKVTLKGAVDIQTDKVTGIISLDGEAVYQYLDVAIESPVSPPGATIDTGTPVSATNLNEEEGQTSSISNERNSLIEVRG
jgi:hypothetical protein